METTEPVAVIEDARKTGLKNGLRQLTVGQIKRVLSYREPMLYDEFNYKDGMYCPLAVACGLPGAVKDPTDDKVVMILLLMGYQIRNTRGIPGEFYTTNRAADLVTTAKEVLAEKEAK